MYKAEMKSLWKYLWREYDYLDGEETYQWTFDMRSVRHEVTR